MEKKEGIATEIAKKEELTPEEKKEELKKAGLDFLKEIHETQQIAIAIAIWAVLCFLPAIAEFTHLKVLSFLLNPYVIKFPMIIVWISVAALVVTLPLWLSEHYRVKKGGCKDEHHTVVLIREGPFKVVRNPEYTALILLFVFFSIIASLVIRFTVLSIVGDAVLIAGFYKLAITEEKFNLRKWGDEYRQYLKDVPRFNFIRGLWNLRKRGN